MKTPKNPTIIICFFMLNFCLCFSDENKLSQIVINKELRTVTVSGSIQLKKGILEFAAASNKTNRDYESFILLNTMPSELNNALEKINLKPGKDSTCKITIEWLQDKAVIKRDLSVFFQLNDAKAEFKGLSWVYTAGKKDAENKLIEDKNGEIIALQPNAPGVLVATPDYGNPYDEGENKGFSINQSKLLEEIPELKEKESFPIQLKIEIAH